MTIANMPIYRQRSDFLCLAPIAISSPPGAVPQHYSKHRPLSVVFPTVLELFVGRNADGEAGGLRLRIGESPWGSSARGSLKPQRSPDPHGYPISRLSGAATLGPSWTQSR